MGGDNRFAEGRGKKKRESMQPCPLVTNFCLRASQCEKKKKKGGTNRE